ncbi:MAG TPA: DUF2339 domain-containing protein, partial [Xanthomonadales bacterium]|nr:DUF2339 domain-containing protein [Xanthomonadales bacterium]
DARVRDLESSVRGLRAELDSSRVTERVEAPAPPPQPAPAPPAPPAATVPDAGAPWRDPTWPTYDQMFGRPMPGTSAPDDAAATAAPRQRPARVSFETLLAGRAMPIAGLLLVLLAAAFFLDQAFRNGWIGPLERIVLGLVVGSALIFVAARRIGAAYTFLAEGLIGLGAGILYLSLWAGVAKFPELHVSRPAVFAAMIAVTAVLSVLASTRDSQRLALMGMFGGFITPLLLANGQPDRVVLAAYLLVLAAAMLLVSVRSSFRFVEALTFVAIVCYAPAFTVDPAQHWGDVQCAIAATLFFAAFAVAFTLGALRDGVASTARIVLLACDTALYVLALEELFDHKQTTLGIVLLVLAAALLAATRVAALPRRLQLVYAYLGLASVTLAIPALFHSTSLIDVFAVEAALLVAIGARNGDRWVLAAGAVLFACTGIAILSQGASDPPHRTIFNPLSLGFAIYLGALGFALSRYAASGPITRAQSGWRNAAVVAWNLVALSALSRECVDLLGGPKGFDNLANEAQFGLSAIWTVYATVLFAVGMWRHQALLRWLGLALFGCTIFKVFVVDMAALNVMYRILSFLVLGIVLVAVSIGYQRAMVDQKGAEAEG